MDKNAPILVTGGTGFLGSYIVRTLLAGGYTRLRCLKRENSPTALLGEAAGEVEWVNGDLLDYQSLRRAVDDCQGIIHAAAIVSFRKKDRRRMMAVNAEATANLVNLALDNGVKRFIYISSVAALGRYKDRKVVDEDCHFQFGPLDTGYGASKYLGEMEVWRGAAEGLNMAVLNPPLILGSGFWERGSGRMFTHIYNGFRFYPTGCSGWMDVRDVAGMSMMLLQREDISGERFICAERTAPQKEIMDRTAVELSVRGPHIPLTKLLIGIAWRLAWLKRLLTGDGSIITRETLRVSQYCFEVDNSRSREELNFTYIPIERTIRETAGQFLEAAKENFAPKYLPLHYAKV